MAMVGDFSFSDSGAQLALANAEYWWASASFHSHFRSSILSSFIFTITSKFLALRVSGLDFLKKVSSWGIKKNAQVTVSNFETGESQSPKVSKLPFDTPSFSSTALNTYCADRV